MRRRHALPLLLLATAAACACVAAASPAAAPRSTGVHVHLLLDRSGSMAPLKGDVVGGVNAFIEDQRQAAGDQDIRLSIVQFDTQNAHQVMPKFDAASLSEHAGPVVLTEADFVPRGGTPLLDAIGLVVARAERLSNSEKGLPPRARRLGKPAPATAQVIAIFTDGEENSSQEHTNDSVRRLIEAKKEEGWAFLFLGANQDAFSVANAFGVGRSSTQNFFADRGGVKSAFDSLSKGLKMYAQKAKRSAARAARFAESAGSAADAVGEGVEKIFREAAETFFEGVDYAQQDFEQRTGNSGSGAL